MADTPLTNPAAIYRPFTGAETEQLREFVAAVRRLGHMRFFEQVPQRATLAWDAETGARAEMAQPDDEALRAAITQFRQLYDPSEPHSFQRAMKLSKRSVHERDSPLRDQALEHLDGHLNAERAAIRAGIGVAIIFETPEGSRNIDTRTIIDAYFHGQYLHSGNPKSKLARQLDDLQPWPRYTLYSVMLVLRNVYWNAANAAERVLSMPELLDHEG